MFGLFKSKEQKMWERRGPAWTAMSYAIIAPIREVLGIDISSQVTNVQARVRAFDYFCSIELKEKCQLTATDVALWWMVNELPNMNEEQFAVFLMWIEQCSNDLNPVMYQQIMMELAQLASSPE